MSRQVNSAGIQLIKSWEGLVLKPYLDSLKIPTIGYGTTFYEDGSKVAMTDAPITKERAEALLAIHVNDFAKQVEAMITVPITDNQFAALVSFAYNAGPGALRGSTLLKKLNAKDYAGAADQFLVWNKGKDRVTGQMVVISGLNNRRQAERSLFLQTPVVQSSSGQLGNGPSDQDISVKLSDIEKGII